MLDTFLKSSRLGNLFILPLLLCATKAIMYYIEVEPISENNFYSSYGISIMLLIISFLMFNNYERYKLFRQTTVLPTIIYLVMTLACLYKGDNNYILTSLLSLVLAFYCLRVSIEQLSSNVHLYNFGLFGSIAILINPELLLLYIWMFYVSCAIGRTTGKDFVALLLGCLTPIFFYSVYLFGIDNLESTFNTYLNVVNSTFEVDNVVITTEEVVFCIIIAILLIIGTVTKSSINNNFIISHRFELNSYVSLLPFLIVICIIYPSIRHDVWYIFAYPLSVLSALTLILKKNKIINTTIVVLIILSTLYTFLFV